MPQVVRRGDPNSAGGLAGGNVASTVLVNGRPVVLPGAAVTPHPCCGLPGCAVHCAAVTTRGSSKVYAEGRPIVYVGSPDSCGHTRARGSRDVIIGI